MSMTVRLRSSEIPSATLADWLDQETPNRWWAVDGDPILTGEVSFPCPTDELTAELRRINGTLEVKHHLNGTIPAGWVLDAAHFFSQGNMSEPEEERIFEMRWLKPRETNPWLLIEDTKTMEEMIKVDAAGGVDNA